jgi:hypothetical protein
VVAVKEIKRSLKCLYRWNEWLEGEPDAMKNSRSISSIGAALFLFVLMMSAWTSPSVAKAQWQPTVYEANIPFDFQVGNKKMPAGFYRFESRPDNPLVLHGPNDSLAFISVHDAIAPNVRERGGIIFSRYGQTYFLRQVWNANTQYGLECSKGRTEKEMEHASNSNQTSSLITLAFETFPRK